MLENNLSAGGTHASLRSIKDPEVHQAIYRDADEANSFYPSPSSWEDQVLYFLLPDRFAQGSENDSLDISGKPLKGDTKAYDVVQDSIVSDEAKESWKNAGICWQGGTLRGVKSKLGYLKRMGVTAVWIGPIFKQVPHDEHSYHGYAVQNFLNIDPHFGVREDLKDLVQAAHKEGIYVILDIILNHSGDVFGYKDENTPYKGTRYEVAGFRNGQKEAVLPFEPLNEHSTENIDDCAIWPTELQNPDTFTREGSIGNWDKYPEYLRGDFMTLKDINLGDDGNPENPRGDIENFAPTPALNTLCEVYKYWIAYADLDGYRIDTVKHMGDGPTRHLCTTLHEFAATLGKENFFLVGEVTGNRAYDVVQVTGLNAALGIGNVQQKLWLICKGWSNPNEYFELFRNAAFLKKGSDAWMRDKVVTMIDDHDQVWRGESKARFCSDFEGKQLALAAMGLNLTSLGVPCIYYGTEQLFDGQGPSDRYLRETMFGGTFGAFCSKEGHFFNESTAVFQNLSKICQIRTKHLALRRGRQYLREISANGADFGYPHILNGRIKSIIAWSRIIADQEVLCAINTDTEKATTAYVTVDAGLHRKGDCLACLYSSDGSTQQAEISERNGKAALVTVPPAGFIILK